MDSALTTVGSPALVAGAAVRLKSSPDQIGVLTGQRHEGRSLRLEVRFPNGCRYVPELALELVDGETSSPFARIRAGRYGRLSELRRVLTHVRLSGRLSDIIYSLDTTNTDFYAYQFKPVLSFLDSPAQGILIADEVGLGKTIEAGLIWTELRSREDANRLLVVCPAVLQEKWRRELSLRFGIEAVICSAGDVYGRAKELAGTERHHGMAIIASMQGLRPPSGWTREADDERGAGAGLARFLAEFAEEKPLQSLFDLVIIDEAHYLRNPETQTSRLGRLLRPVAANMVLLSATPIQLKSRDLFQLLNLLDADSFPYEWSFNQILEENVPLVTLRDELLRGSVTGEEFAERLGLAKAVRRLGRSELLERLLESPPSTTDLASAAFRAELADRIDRMNPLSKVVTRTRKRDVHERKVVRSPTALLATMTGTEARFYGEVTESVRKYCTRTEIREGFLLTIPQRQMCSSMPAACRAWRRRFESVEFDDEIARIAEEAFGDDIEPAPAAGSGRTNAPLVAELARIAADVGDFDALKAGDSKFAILWKNLSDYWSHYPDRKVVLFSYFRETLHYLAERFEEKQVRVALLMGGMDKDAVLDEFASTRGPKLLLSSEVASEGVDLQFSSLLVNYDLPWNPMKIEQRIGRIDRIGQQAERILIWNIFCADTLDDRVYHRLLSRLHVFEAALGATEAILGEKVREMTYELLRHHLSSEEEEAVIEQTAVAVEINSRHEEELEQEAIRLVAHGDYIQEKIHSIRDLNRFVSDADLLNYVKGYFERAFPGSQFIPGDSPETAWEVELTPEARVGLQGFLRGERLEGATRLAVPGGGRVRCRFQNRLQKNSRDVEVISQYHPVTAFVSRQTGNEAVEATSLCAIEISRHEAGGAVPGVYAYAVGHWTVTGSRNIEKLAFCVWPVEAGTGALDAIDSERLISLATGTDAGGKPLAVDWLNATGEVDGTLAESAFERCVEQLESEFDHFLDVMACENQDRIALQLGILERHHQRKNLDLNTRIANLELARSTRIIPAIRGQLDKFNKLIEERRTVLSSKSSMQSEQKIVSGGLINVT
jgi:superfamily II DNA or RNA helicase